MKIAARGMWAAGISCVCTTACLLAIRADAAVFLTSISAGAPSVAEHFEGLRSVTLPTGTLMSLQDNAHGGEIWITDHTPQGTRLLLDSTPGPVGGAGDWFSNLGNVTVYRASDPIHGIELWRSDGTTAGTYLLADIGPGLQNYLGNGVGYPTTVLNGVLYFSADDGVTGSELWRTDGTREGTHIVADLVPGYEGSHPSNITASATHIFFAREQEVWVSDGTAPGTRKIADLGGGGFVSVGNTVFFPGRNAQYGTELWRADADGQNVTLVADLNTETLGGAGSSYPAIYVVRNDSILFMAQTPLVPPVNGTGSDCRLYRANASGGGAIELANFARRCHIDKVIEVPGGVLFSLWPSGLPTEKEELWISDGTAAGTQKLDLNDLFYSERNERPFNFAKGPNGEAYFFGRQGINSADKIWRTDGTRAGTRVFADVGSVSDRLEIAYLNGRVYFDATSLAGGSELWTSDGTPAGTQQVMDIQPGSGGSSIADLEVINGRLQFFAKRLSPSFELWTSDGTTAGTIYLGQSNGVAPADASIVFGGQVGSRVVFAADRGYGAQGNEVNVTDGTAAGTVLLREINTGGSSNPANFFSMGAQMLFVAASFNQGRELWRTDGTTSGTISLTDINGSDSDNVTVGAPGSVLNGIAYFTAGATLAWPELWRTDGTTAGTFQVTGNIGQRISIIGGNATFLVYRALSQPSGAARLWSWNGTSAQIVTAADNLKISAEPGVVHGGRVCFRAWDASPQSLDVWCTNGTPGDLVRATNFAALGVSAGEMLSAGDILLVNALGAGAASGLYSTQGAAAGMRRISASRFSTAQVRGANSVVFAAENGTLMLTDGTSVGTRELLQGVTLPGVAPGGYGVLANYVVFTVNDPQRGAVLWRTDGTASGARYLADLDLATTPVGADGMKFFTASDRLLVSTYRPVAGNEIWSVSATDPNASGDAAAATGGVALTVNVLDNDADIDGALNAASVVIVNGPLNGAASVNATTGAITYTPTAWYSGTDTLQYRVADTQGRNSNTATVTFQVTAGAAPPAPPPPAPPSGGGKGGGAMGIEVLWLLMLVILKLLPPQRRVGVR
jgi:ELWxxDGT repeat protein